MTNLLHWIRRTILNVAKPFLKWSSGVHLPFTHKYVTGIQYYELYPHLKPGLIFVTRIRGDLTTFLIPGFWTHAAIYTPQLGVPDEIVTEAEGPGVLWTDLITFMLTKDYLMALEPKGLGDKKDAIMKRAAEIAAIQHGSLYDYDFEFHISGNKAFYCSELVWWAYDQACMEFEVPSPFKPRMSLGTLTMTPEDIATDMDNFSVLFSTKAA